MELSYGKVHFCLSEETIPVLVVGTWTLIINYYFARHFNVPQDYRTLKEI